MLCLDHGRVGPGGQEIKCVASYSKEPGRQNLVIVSITLESRRWGHEPIFPRIRVADRR
jgi:hypothetical protein